MSAAPGKDPEPPAPGLVYSSGNSVVLDNIILLGSESWEPDLDPTLRWYTPWRAQSSWTDLRIFDVNEGGTKIHEVDEDSSGKVWVVPPACKVRGSGGWGRDDL